jgi:hypothetical protein
MFVLPQILILGGRILEKTSFSMPAVSREKHASGLVAVDGLIVGEIRGNVNGVFRGTVDGEVNVRLLSGKIGEDEALPTDSPAETEEKPEEKTEAETPPEPVPAEEEKPRTEEAGGEEDEADD